MSYCPSDYIEANTTFTCEVEVDLDKTIFNSHAVVTVTVTDTHGDGPNSGNRNVDADEQVSLYVCDDDAEDMVWWHGDIDVASAWLGINLEQAAADIAPAEECYDY